MNLPPPYIPSLLAHSNILLLSMLIREKLMGTNYLDSICTLRITLRYENKGYVLDEDLPELADDATNEQAVTYDNHYDELNNVACLMLATMSYEL